MQIIDSRILALVASFSAAVLLAGGAAAREAQQAEPAPQAPAERGQTAEASPAPARRTLPRITGIVQRWTGNRIDLETPDGTMQKVAVNRDTERLVEIATGAQVTVEYRRKISGFVIAQRVLPAGEQKAVPAGTGAVPGVTQSTLTGSIVSWSEAALVLKTDSGDVTLFLSPSTEYQVEALAPGLAVTVEYQQDRDQARLATRVRAAGTAGEAEGSSEPAESPAPPGPAAG